MTTDDLTASLSPAYATTDDVRTLAEGVDVLAETTEAGMRDLVKVTAESIQFVSEQCAKCDASLARDVDHLRDQFRLWRTIFVGAWLGLVIALILHITGVPGWVA